MICFCLFIDAKDCFSWMMTNNSIPWRLKFCTLLNVLINASHLNKGNVGQQDHLIVQ